jgi:hypothetical protein
VLSGWPIWAKKANSALTSARSLAAGTVGLHEGRESPVTRGASAVPLGLVTVAGAMLAALAYVATRTR